jgi:dGTPase
MSMNWAQLMSRARIDCTGAARPSVTEEARSDFERDWDRILFSAAFRRMHDKTQVFPLPEDDVIHSRLTHSLEVASVGRSLGKLVGKTICERHGIEHSAFSFHDVGDVVAAACLAHDIGNPPFGHAGEDAIASFFRSGHGAIAISSLSSREKADLTSFEGNAQGFRVLTRLQIEADGGLQLTAATLGAFCKYPRESGDELHDRDLAATKKHGVFQEDRHVLDAVAAQVGLIKHRSHSEGNAWCRHPLAFLVEAADDICYSILDIEDGVRLGHASLAEATNLFRPLAQRAAGFSQERLRGFEGSPKACVGYLRAMAIGTLISECVDTFLNLEQLILDGTQPKGLAKEIPSKAELRALTEFARTNCYQARSVVEIELAGYEALGGLLECFVGSVVRDEGGTEREQRFRLLLPKRGGDLRDRTLYGRILRATDYVSGMTDRHALATYRRLKGIALPGRAGA